MTWITARWPASSEPASASAAIARQSIARARSVAVPEKRKGGADGRRTSANGISALRARACSAVSGASVCWSKTSGRAGSLSIGGSVAWPPEAVAALWVGFRVRAHQAVNAAIARSNPPNRKSRRLLSINWKGRHGIGAPFTFGRRTATVQFRGLQFCWPNIRVKITRRRPPPSGLATPGQDKPGRSSRYGWGDPSRRSDRRRRCPGMP
jgi:hypothetical protein